MFWIYSQRERNCSCSQRLLEQDADLRIYQCPRYPLPVLQTTHLLASEFLFLSEKAVRVLWSQCVCLAIFIICHFQCEILWHFSELRKVRHVLIWSISGVFSTEVDVTGSSTIHSEARRRARDMSPDSSGADQKLESLLLHFGRKPSLRSCERWGVREFYLSIYLPIMLYCVVWLLLVGFTGIFVYNFPHVTHLAVELTHRWRG